MLTVTLVGALMTNDAVAQPDSLESVLHGDVIMNVGVEGREGRREREDVDGEGRRYDESGSESDETAATTTTTMAGNKTRAAAAVRPPLSKRPMAAVFGSILIRRLLVTG